MILLVDDEPYSLEMLRRKLAAEGFDVLTAVTVPEAMETLVAQGGLRVLITDLHMPGIDGFELLEWTQMKYPHIIRMILSAHTYEDDMGKNMDSGLTQVILNKPVDVEHQILPFLRRIYQK